MGTAPFTRWQMLRLRLVAWTHLVRQRGPLILLRLAQRALEDRLVSRGHLTALRAMRVWHLALLVLGVWICSLASCRRWAPTDGPSCWAC